MLADRVSFPSAAEWDEWLLNHGAGDQVSEKIIKLKKIIADGAVIEIFQTDISAKNQVAALIDDVFRKFGAVDGVVHAAGIPAAGLIQQKTMADAQEAMSAKVLGTGHLARALRQLPSQRQPRFLILFSTFSTVVGAFGQAAYVAANTYLDVFSGYASHETGLSVMSIDWDRWTGTGMAARLEGEGISPAEGAEAFGTLLGHLELLGKRGVRRVVVTPHALDDWDDQARASGMEGMVDHIERIPVARHAAGKKRPRVSVAYTPPSTSLEKRLADLWKEFLGIEQVGTHDNFFELGASSLDLVQFNARLNRAVQRDVGLVHLYAHPTVASLANFLAGNGGESAPVSEARSMLAGAARKLRKD